MVKRVQYQEVEFSVNVGCDMPTDANGLIEFCEAVKQDPTSNCDPDKWFQDDGVEITAFDVEEVNTPEGE